MEQTILLSVILLAMLSHVLAAFSGILVIKKYEQSIQRLCFKSLFDVNNFYSHKMWFVLLSFIVSLGYLSVGAEIFIKVFNATKGLNVLKYVLLNLAVGVTILQYNYFTLKDRRNKVI